MKNLSFLFLFALFLFSCSSPPPESGKDSRVPAEISEYFRASADGQWAKVCELLSQQERVRIKRELRAPCSEALKKIGWRLRKKAKTARIRQVEDIQGLWRVETASPPGEIWLQDKKIYFSRP